MSFENYPDTLESASSETMTTISGKEISLCNPSEDDIEIDDIANGLSLECRFGKQIARHYSVAQHSLLVAALAPHPLKQMALLHDASEAYLGDVIKPLKHILGKTYKEIEHRFEVVIFKKFGLDVTRLPEIKKYDLLAYWLEERALKKDKPAMLEATMRDHDMIIGGSHVYYQSTVAKIEFLKMFDSLFNNLSNQEA